MKKAQITVFMIIGFLVLIVFAFLFWVLTVLLPIRIAARNSSGFSRSLDTIFAFLFPVSARCLILIFPTERSAVSEREKKAENTINTDIVMISNVIQESIRVLTDANYIIVA